MMFKFAGYTFDPIRRELRLQDKVIHVEPQVFDVLGYLIENRDRVVTKDELFTSVWFHRSICTIH